MATDRFGFLPVNRAVNFTGGRIEPVPGLEALIDEVRFATRQDDGYSWIYGPPDSTGTPAFLFQMPASHALTLDAASGRSADAAFIMYFLGHLFGYRLQFEGWWFDGRLPMQEACWDRWWSFLPEAKVSGLVSDAYRVWRAWPLAERTRFTNLLYMHVRSFSYGWDWERFTVRYMVFDGCYRMARALGYVDDVPHSSRLDAMLAWAGMPTESASVSRIVGLRNDLFHEALWDAGQPGTASREGIRHADDLWRISDRLLFALAGYTSDYVKVGWWRIGRALI